MSNTNQTPQVFSLTFSFIHDDGHTYTFQVHKTGDWDAQKQIWQGLGPFAVKTYLGANADELIRLDPGWKTMPPKSSPVSWIPNIIWDAFIDALRRCNDAIEFIQTPKKMDKTSPRASCYCPWIQDVALFLFPESHFANVAEYDLGIPYLPNVWSMGKNNRSFINIHHSKLRDKIVIQKNGLYCVEMDEQAARLCERLTTHFGDHFYVVEGNE